MGNALSCWCCTCCDGKHRNNMYEPLLNETEREAVGDLLQFLENRTEDVVLAGEPLKALTTLSYSNNIDLQRSAALAFAEITERRLGEADAAVLEPLLHMLRESIDVEVQRASSAALGNLAVDMGNKLKIVRLGGLEPLIRQMNSSNVEVQCNAVGCITNLATHDENKSAIARSGALIPLIRLARHTKDIRVQRNATGALLNMTHSEDNRRQLVEAGAITVLVSLLRSPDTDVVYYCITAISNLAVDAGNRKKLSHEARLINELVELMENKSLKVQCQSILALRNLASDGLYQLEIAKHPRSLRRLLLLVTGMNHEEPDMPRIPHPQIILACVACVRNISIHPENETKIIEVGFLKPLVNLLSHESEEIQCHAISTLRNLAASTAAPSDLISNTESDNKVKIVQSGALEKLEKLLEDISKKCTSMESERIPWDVLNEITACMAVLALSDILKPHLLQTTVVESLLLLTLPHISGEVQGNAAAALGNLATKAPTSKPFIEKWADVCDYLERFIDTGRNRLGTEDEETTSTFQHIAVWTILQFCENDPIFKEKLMKRMKIVNALRSMHQVNRDEEVLQLVQRILSFLSLTKM